MEDSIQSEERSVYKEQNANKDHKAKVSHSQNSPERNSRNEDNEQEDNLGNEHETVGSMYDVSKSTTVKHDTNEGKLNSSKSTTNKYDSNADKFDTSKNRHETIENNLDVSKNSMNKHESVGGKYESLRQTLHEEQKRFVQVQTLFASCQEKQTSLQIELEELRSRLKQIEMSYAMDAIKIQEQTMFLKSKLQQIFEMNKATFNHHPHPEFEELYTSTNSFETSASQSEAEQIISLQEQTRLIEQKRETVQELLTAAEDEVERQGVTLRNLHGVLERLRGDEGPEADAMRWSVCLKVEATQQKQTELFREINALKSKLEDGKEGSARNVSRSGLLQEAEDEDRQIRSAA